MTIETTPAGIGDVNSTARGSGARFNTGKAPYDLLPLRLMANYYRESVTPNESQDQALRALACLGEFQETRNYNALIWAMLALGPGAWIDCAHVFGYGKRKYAAWNWSKGMPWSVPLACCARHLEAIILGEGNDLESTLPHRGHAMCNLVMLATYTINFKDGDDLPPVGLLSGAEVIL